MPKIQLTDIERINDVEQFERIPIRPVQHRSSRRAFSPPARKTRSEEFKCGNCKTFVGPPISGGKHRNHCPLCLFSRHVDRGRPGDRLSDCHCLMKPTAVTFRRNGEQVIVHHCLGCHVERYCRVAADDNMVMLMKLPPISQQERPANSEESTDVGVA